MTWFWVKRYACTVVYYIIVLPRTWWCVVTDIKMTQTGKEFDLQSHNKERIGTTLTYSLLAN